MPKSGPLRCCVGVIEQKATSPESETSTHQYQYFKPSVIGSYVSGAEGFFAIPDTDTWHWEESQPFDSLKAAKRGYMARYGREASEMHLSTENARALATHAEYQEVSRFCSPDGRTPSGLIHAIRGLKVFEEGETQ
ncbi:MAG TPA: hypothetical protein VN519_06735 [Bryobacteraceae bacterium]|nr:hypothetical protein [Bryobacteraceae bacterium]